MLRTFKRSVWKQGGRPSPSPTKARGDGLAVRPATLGQALRSPASP
ncbi:hypothetical protein XAB3213_3310014 [Xanthomonas citri pv. bilvae]|nr:hypothetical protein XAB3213_3310014 [Xanthomonas citri pv. bilvae]